YDRLPAAPAEALQAWSRQLVMPEQEGVLLAVRRELTGGLTKMTGAEPVVTRALGAKPAIVAVTAEQAVALGVLGAEQADALHAEGFVLRTVRRNAADGEAPIVLIAGGSPRGVLYGAFHLLR